MPLFTTPAVQTDGETKQSPFQQVIGSKIARFVLWGTVLIGITGIVFAFLLLRSDADENKIKSAFSIIQYIFGALLPLWGTWIGTILAYYFSKDNFDTASRSVQQLVEKITSDKKLEGVKAKDVMIRKDALIFQTLQSGETLAKFKLKADCLDFLRQKKIKRLLILDDKNHALYAIHRDLMALFIAEQAAAAGSTPDAIAALTLDDMHTKGSGDIINTMDNSVKFIGENASLIEAKRIMDQFRTCQDVFITPNGQQQEAVLGWVTNVTIAENSIV